MEIKFTDSNGDFGANLSISIPSLKTNGVFSTNFQQQNALYLWPNIQFIGNDESYESEIENIEIVIQIKGNAPPIGPLTIYDAGFSFNSKNQRMSFSNLNLNLTNVGAWGQIEYEYNQNIKEYQDIPKYFEWRIIDTYTYYEVHDTLKLWLKCLLSDMLKVKK